METQRCQGCETEFVPQTTGPRPVVPVTFDDGETLTLCFPCLQNVLTETGTTLRVTSEE